MLLALDSGNTAWVLISAALVLFMTPGLAFFYGGMVRSKNVLGMLMQNMFAIGLVSTIWAVVGFSLVFGDSGNGWIGNFDFLFLADVTNLDGDIPGMAFVAFQMMFAVITPALITGATADRLKFGSYAVLIGFWSLLVYIPGAKWVFNGWLLEMGALDFAGGTAIHISAGVAALAVVLVIGNRKGHGDVPMPPHNLPFTASLPTALPRKLSSTPISLPQPACSAGSSWNAGRAATPPCLALAPVPLQGLLPLPPARASSEVPRRSSSASAPGPCVSLPCRSKRG